MKLLVVEDDEKIRSLLTNALEEDGHVIEGSGTAEEAMDLVAANDYDLFMLDIMLPGKSGHELCRWLRDRGCKAPILLLTALGGVNDKVNGLDSGADDYMTKPFELVEVKARVRAFQRKLAGYPRAALRAADLELDPDSQTVTRAGVGLDVSKKEFALLECLVRRKNQLVTRAAIASAVWEVDTAIYSNIIDVFINSLRKKVDREGWPRLIHTVRGKGFVLAEDPSLIAKDPPNPQPASGTR